MAQPAAPDTRPVARGIVTVLLLIAIGGALAVPVYARSQPQLGDFPFFYWYQLLCVPAVAALCWLSYLLLRTKPAPAAAPTTGGPGNGGGLQQ